MQNAKGPISRHLLIPALACSFFSAPTLSAGH